MADEHAADRPVEPRVKRADVGGAEAAVVDFVQFEEVIIAGEDDGVARRVVDEVVRGVESHGVGVFAAHGVMRREIDRGGILALQHAVVVEVVVHRVTPRGREGAPVAAAHENAAAAEVVKVAALHAVVRAVERGAGAGEVAQRAAGEQDIVAALHEHAVAERVFERESDERDVRGVARAHERGGELRDGDVGFCEIRGRPEVERARCEIHGPLAGLIDFLDEIDGPIRFLAVAVWARVFVADPEVKAGSEGNVFFRGIDGGDEQGGIFPADAPVALEPEATVGGPARGAVLAVFENAGRASVAIHDGARHGDGAGVRPARERHTGAVDEEFKQSAVVGEHFRKWTRAGDAARGEVELHHVVARERIEPRAVAGRIGALKIGCLQQPRAVETGLGAGGGAIHHGRFGRAGVGGSELERRGELIGAIAQRDGDAAGRESSFLAFERAHGFASARERGKRLLRGPGRAVAAVGRHEKFAREFGFIDDDEGRRGERGRGGNRGVRDGLGQVASGENHAGEQELPEAEAMGATGRAGGVHGRMESVGQVVGALRHATPTAESSW
jgi:hypothetical protein